MFSPAKIALFALLTGCSVGAVPGDVTPDTPPAPPSAGELAFNSMIDPLLTNCKSCHAGTPPILTSYKTLDAKYKTPPGASNIFVTKADATAGMHYGMPYFPAPQRDTVINWINSNP